MPAMYATCDDELNLLSISTNYRLKLCGIHSRNIFKIVLSTVLRCHKPISQSTISISRHYLR